MKARRPIAAVALTRGGAFHARRLREALEGVHPFVEERWAPLVGEPCTPFRLPLRPLLSRLFHTYPSLVLFTPVGVAVRLLTGLPQHKKRDPAVVTVDEAGRFAVCLLSGHRGGGEALAREVAEALRAVPVLTSASASLGLPPLDLLGWEHGWEVEDPRALTAVMSALVNGELVGLVQEAGEPWPPDGVPLPPNLRVFPSLEALLVARPPCALVITDRLLSPEEREALPGPTALYRPRTLVAGVGCRRGVPAGEVRAFLEEVFARHRLSLRSLFCLATADRKGEEEGLRETARALGVPLRLFRAEEMERVAGRVGPSASRRYLGLPSVSEASALLASGTSGLLVPRQRTARLTVAVARREVGR